MKKNLNNFKLKKDFGKFKISEKYITRFFAVFVFMILFFGIFYPIINMYFKSSKNELVDGIEVPRNKNEKYDLTIE